MKFKFITTFFLFTNFLFFHQPIAAQFFDRPDFFQRGDELMEREIRNLQRRNPDPNPTYTISNSDGSQQWQAFVFNAARFSIWLPQGVFSQKTTDLKVDRQVFEFQQISANLPSEKFIVAYLNDPKQFKFENEDKLLNELRDAIIERTRFKLIEETPLTFDRYSGKEITLNNDKEIIVLRIYLIQEEIYVLGVSQLLKSQNQQQRSIFFNSFNPFNPLL